MDKLKYIKLENEDGSYSSSIPLAVDSDYVDVNGTTLTNELNSKANIVSVNSSVNNLQSQINGLASGSPLIASSVSEMVDTTHVYVNTTDGHWYWYNGNSWVDGGIYQATGVSRTDTEIEKIYGTISTQLNNENLNNFIVTNYWIGTGNPQAGKGGVNTSVVVNVSSISGKLIVSTLETQPRYRLGLCTSAQFNSLIGTPTAILYSYLQDGTNNTLIIDVSDGDYLIINATDITKIAVNKEYNYKDDYKNIDKSLITRYDGSIFHHGKLGTSFLQADGYYNIGDASGKASNPIEVLTGDKLIVNNLVYDVQSDYIYCMFTDDKGYVISYLTTDNANYNNKYMEITVPDKATRVYFGCNNGANLDQITITRIRNNISDKLNKFETKPNYFILDTDLASDIDDAMALRIVSWAERNNMIDLLGLILSCNGTQTVNGTTYYSKICADVLFQYDGLKNVKMGCYKDKNATSRYYSDITNNFYHTLTGTNNGLSGSTNVYRRMLASIPEGRKCTIAIVGYLTAFSDLLNVVSDAYSPLSGIELVREKVDKVYIMGGTYPQSSIIETNFSVVDATNNVLTNCPVPMIFLGNEWETVKAGQSLIADNKTYDPVYVALHEYWTSRDGQDSIKPRMAWDPLTTLLAIIGNEAMGMSLVQGTNSINTDTTSPNYGFNTFTPSSNGKDFYVTRRYDNKFYQDAINDILDKKAWMNKKNI